MSIWHLRDEAALQGPRQWARLFHSSLLKAALVVLALVALIVAMLWFLTADRRAISSMPVEQRRAVYAETLKYVQTVCAGKPEGAVAAHCREQAEFLIRFPECDRECWTLAGPHLSAPTK